MSGRRSGWALLELLIAISLFSVASASTFATVHSVQRIRTSLQIRAKRVYAETRSMALISHLVSDADTHRLPYPFRIHSSSQLAFTDGTPHPALTSKLKGDSITGYALSLIDTYTVRESTEGSAFGCQKYTSGLSLAPIRSFLVISIDGESEMTGSAQQQGNGCAQFRLVGGRSVSFPQTAEPPYAVVIPIIRHYSLSVDRENTLRYITHAGEEVVEYQPIVGDALPLKLSHQNAPVPSVEFHRAKNISSYSVLLERREPFDILATLYAP